MDIGGHNGEPDVGINFAQMMARKDEVVDTLVSSVIELVKAHKVDIYEGLGTILKPGLVQVKMDGDGSESGIRQPKQYNGQGGLNGQSPASRSRRIRDPASLAAKTTGHGPVGSNVRSSASCPNRQRTSAGLY